MFFLIGLKTGSLRSECWRGGFSASWPCEKISFLLFIKAPAYQNRLPLVWPWASLVAQLVNNPPAMWDLGSIPGLGRSLGEGTSYPLQFSGLENSMDWNGVAMSQTWLSDFHSMWPCMPTKLLQFCPTLWTVACQVPLSKRFFKQEYWSGLLCPPPGDLSRPGVKPESLQSPALVLYQ